jgi:hypothetical protein
MLLKYITNIISEINGVRCVISELGTRACLAFCKQKKYE